MGENENTIYDLKVKTRDDKDFALSELRGKVLLIVKYKNMKDILCKIIVMVLLIKYYK